MQMTHWSIAIASSLATIAVCMTLIRFLPQNQTSRFFLRWRRVPALAAASGIAVALAAISVLSIKTLDGNGGGVSVADAALLPTIPVLPVFEAPESANVHPDGKARAIANLRDYAERIRGKQQVIASLDGNADPAAAAPTLPDVETMIERLAKRVAADPSNTGGLAMLGWSYVNTGKYAEAVETYRKAVANDPGDSKLQAALADAETRLAGGRPEPGATGAR